MNADLPAVKIYTDGACEPNPGAGGWAALLIFSDHAPTGWAQEQSLTGSDRHTTNNRMELTAAIRALSALPQPMRVTLYTDSQYLQRGICEWLPNWLKKNWRGSSGKVANRDLWQELIDAASRHQVTWRWVRGHAGDRNNTRVDRLANRAIPR